MSKPNQKSKQVSKKVERPGLSQDEVDEIKQAFDLFDIYSTGKLDQVALHDAFKALGFEKDSYSVFSVINSFNTNNKVIKQGGVDWETFKDAVKSLIGDFDSKEGIRKLFELFVDDPNQDTITSDTLKKVAADLNDDLSNKELKEIMKRAAHNGVDIDFEEFYKEDLYNLPNIHTYGFVEQRSALFYAIIRQCSYSVLLSCSEGSPGSVIESMQQGLIPIITKESHINLPKAGIIVRNLDVTSLQRTFTKASDVSASYVELASEQVRSYADREYSVSNFETKLASIIRDISQDSLK